MDVLTLNSTSSFHVRRSFAAMKPIHAIVQLPTTKGGRQPTPDVSVQYIPSPRHWIRRIPNAHSSESDTAPHHDIDNSDHQIIILTIGIRMRNQEPVVNVQRPAANFSPPGLMTADCSTRNREARGCLEALPCFPKARSCFGNAGQVPSGPASSVFFCGGGVPCGNWELFLGVFRRSFLAACGQYRALFIAGFKCPLDVYHGLQCYAAVCVCGV
jgi:hypothetical protein